MPDVIYEPRGRAREYSALAVNLYTGCGHGCLYCYAPASTRVSQETFHQDPRPRKNILERLEHDARRKQKAGVSGRVLLCFSCDPYQPINEEHRLTASAIMALHAYGFSVQVLTKGGMRAARDFPLYKDGDAFATTLTFLNENLSRKWEPNAALPDERIEAMRIAHSRGIRTWASFEPVVYPAATIALIRRTADVVDEYRVGVLNYHPAGTLTDWPEFAALAVEELKKIGKPYYLKDDLIRLGKLTPDDQYGGGSQREGETRS